MRGTPITTKKYGHAVGIIPAYAGNTEASVSWVCGDGDHPRVCGEHIPAIISSIRNAGSSPRMRGTPLSGEDAFGRVGIIPAYAGNTRSMKSGIGLCGDHPRVCGEHRFIGSNKYRAVGSSPRMRGTLGFSAANADDAGIIPAYAGNTVTHSHRHSHRRDHPRVCGEHQCVVCHDFFVQGSSPRMRGTLVRRNVRFLPYGIIPAYAGNT